MFHAFDSRFFFRSHQLFLGVDGTSGLTYHGILRALFSDLGTAPKKGSWQGNKMVTKWIFLPPKTVTFLVQKKHTRIWIHCWCMVSSCTSMPFRARACLVIHKSKIEMTSLKDKLCVCVFRVTKTLFRCEVWHCSFFAYSKFHFDSFERVFNCKFPPLIESQIFESSDFPLPQLCKQSLTSKAITSWVWVQNSPRTLRPG